MQVPSIPFKVLALAPFMPQEGGISPQHPIRVDKANVDQVIESLGPTLDISLPKNLCPAGGLSIRFNKLKDFHPDGLIRNTPFLRNLLEAKKFVEEAKTKGLSQDEVTQRVKSWPDLPLEIKFEPPKLEIKSESPIDEILKMVSMPEGGPTYSVEIQSFPIQIDSLLRQILSHLFSHEEMRNLESVWRGLGFFIKQCGLNGEMTLDIVSASLENLEETLNHLMPDLIPNPPSLILLDLPFDNSPRSLEGMEKISLFSETLLAPTLCWMTPKFFFLDHWKDLEKLSFLPHYVEESAFAKWRRLRGISSAKWIAAGCNRFLDRYPYGPDNKPVSVYFEESQPLWISPVWAIASLIGQSFLKRGWPTRFTEWQTIKLEGLGLNLTEEKRYLPTEVNFTEERTSQLIKVGMIPLSSIPNKDIAFIPFETTLSGGSLSYQLFLSRITQFLFWCKEHFDTQLEPADIEENLKKAFSLFWEKTGHLTPQRLDISVNKPKPETPAIVRILIEPSRQVLPSGEKIELELNW